jgi:voltage-gated potassium channel
MRRRLLEFLVEKAKDPMATGVKNRLYEILERGRPEDMISRVVDGALILLIVANVAAAAAATVEQFYTRYEKAFWVFEIVSVLIFTVEYLCRLWTCTEHFSTSHQSPLRARMKFVVSPFGLIDLLAILPFYIGFFLPIADLRSLRIFRLLRLLKLVRYSPALATLWQVLVQERRALLAALVIMVILLVMSSTAIYYVERGIQPDKFGSIPAAMWWAVTTMTTVGYGDVVPITVLGRTIGGLVMILGLAMFALPVGIIASGFAAEIHRRDFVVTWGMVARVPIFAKLDAFSISRIANLLRARALPVSTVIFRRGDPADVMYFISYGVVEVDVEPEPVRLRDGDFFGELGLLHDMPRSATVRTVTPCRLLALDKNDLIDLLEEDGDLRAAITEVAEQRLAQRSDP